MTRPLVALATLLLAMGSACDGAGSAGVQPEASPGPDAKARRAQPALPTLALRRHDLDEEQITLSPDGSGLWIHARRLHVISVRELSLTAEDTVALRRLLERAAAARCPAPSPEVQDTARWFAFVPGAEELSFEDQEIPDDIRRELDARWSELRALDGRFARIEALVRAEDYASAMGLEPVEAADVLGFLRTRGLASQVVGDDDPLLAPACRAPGVLWPAAGLAGEPPAALWHGRCFHLWVYR